ncbi:MAG: discoidin domain-containing protein [Anaerolineales bacterium]
MARYICILLGAATLIVACVPGTPGQDQTTASSATPAQVQQQAAGPTPSLDPSETPVASPDLSPRPLLWFAPLPPMTVHEGRPFTGSDDFMDLFDQNAEWQRAAEGVHVFKLYGEWVAYNATDTELRQTVEDIRRRGMALAVEAGPLTATDECGEGIEGFAGLDEGRLIARRIKQAGGRIDIIALDEPYFFAHAYDGPNACHWSAEKIAEGVAGYIQAMRQEFPELIIGDTEPFVGSTTPEEYRGWLLTFREVAGYDLAFLHMDFDWSRRDWFQQALRMEAFGEELGIPIGIIYFGNRGDPDDETWIAVTGERIKKHQIEDAGQPDHILFQSWVDHPDFVLPELNPHSFTGLIRIYLDSPEELGYRGEGAGANLAFNRPARVSALESSHPAEDAVDGDSGTWWSAGAGPVQWIEIDLESDQDIGEIVLIPSQSPAGPTAHRVLGRGSGTGGEFILLHTFSGHTSDSETLSARNPEAWKGIRNVRIVTDSSPSWVAWREVQILAAGR